LFPLFSSPSKTRSSLPSSDRLGPPKAALFSRTVFYLFGHIAVLNPAPVNPPRVVFGVAFPCKPSSAGGGRPPGPFPFLRLVTWSFFSKVLYNCSYEAHFGLFSVGAPFFFPRSFSQSLSSQLVRIRSPNSLIPPVFLGGPSSSTLHSSSLFISSFFLVG